MDERILIPSGLEQGVQDRSGIEPLACSDWCQEMCGTAHESACNCSNQGGEGCTSGCQTACQNCQSCQDACEASSQSINYPTYTFNWGDLGPTSASITVYPTPGYDTFTILCRLASNSSDRTFYLEDIYRPNTFTQIITGLTPETDYIVNVSYGSWIGGTSFTTLKRAILVEKWTWSGSNGLASAQDTNNLYRFLTGQIPYASNLFSYLVWNDLVNKIYEMCQAVGYSWNSQYASLSATLMTSNDRIMTATRFNSALINIGSHYATGLQFQSAGNPIYGSYFTTLASKLNEWIDYSSN